MSGAICGEHLVHFSLLRGGCLLRAVFGAAWTHDVIEEAQRIVIYRAVVETDVVVMATHRDVFASELGIAATDDSDDVASGIGYRLDRELEVEVAGRRADGSDGDIRCALGELRHSILGV